MSEVKVGAAAPIRPETDPDEINLLEYIYALVKNKWLIIGATVLGLVGGYGAAKVKGPTYIAEAVISPKESDGQKSSSSGLSGFLMSQLNVAGNASLDKINLILNSRKFNAELVANYNLLPSIYKVKWPKTYKIYFDTLKNVWTPTFISPKPLEIGGFIKGEYLKKEENKDNTMTIKVETPDSTLSDTLLAKYLFFLNDFLRTQVQTESRTNVHYLNEQLTLVVDPLLREKIQALIANELEKDMLVSKDAFTIIDPPFSSVQFKELKIFPVLFAAVGFFVMVFIIIMHRLCLDAILVSNDRELIKKIRKECLRI